MLGVELEGLTRLTFGACRCMEALVMRLAYGASRADGRPKCTDAARIRGRLEIANVNVNLR